MSLDSVLVECHRALPEPRFWIAIFVSLSLSCTSESSMSPRSAVMSYDSAGVEIVVSRSSAWGPDGGWSLGSGPRVVLGPELGSRRFLYRVGNIERLTDGRLVVENRGSRELFVFDSTGTFLEAWGGVGEGPGELSRMRGLYRCRGGHVGAIDFHRFVVYDSLSRHVRTGELPRQLIGTRREVRGLGVECEAVFGTAWIRRYEPTGLGTHHYPIEAYWASVDDPGVDTLGTVVGFESMEVDGAPLAFPFAYAPSWATDGERVYYGWSERPEIRVLSSTGELRRIIRWGSPSRPVTEDDWTIYEDYRRSRIEANPSYAIPRQKTITSARILGVR